MKFHTEKLKEETSLKRSVKKYALLDQPQEIKIEIEKLGHTVPNIWNIKQCTTKLRHLMFFCIIKTCPE
jgi:hypothetical protein